MAHGFYFVLNFWFCKISKVRHKSRNLTQVAGSGSKLDRIVREANWTSFSPKPEYTDGADRFSLDRPLLYGASLWRRPLAKGAATFGGGY